MGFLSQMMTQGGPTTVNTPTVTIPGMGDGETEHDKGYDYQMPSWLYNAAGPNAIGQAQAAGSTAGFGGYGGAMTQSLNTIGGKNLYATQSPFQDMQGYSDNKSVYVRDPNSPGAWLSYDAMSPQAKAAFQGKYSALNGTNYNMHDANGNIIGQKAFTGLKDKDHVNDVMMAVAGAALGGMAAFGGAAAGGAGAASGGLGGAAGTAGVTGLPEAGLADLFYGGGADLLPGMSGVAGSTLGGGGSFLGAGLGSVAAGVTPAILSSGSSSMYQQLLQKLGSSGLSKIVSGDGSGSGNGGGLSLGDIASLVGGGLDYHNQSKAADTMRQWLDSNQAKMEGYMSPDSPEYKALWEQMSRNDAAAGRNSQYGPRTADFAAKVAQAKAQNTLNFTTGNSRAYSSALNQKAAAPAGLAAALGRSGSGINLSSILNSLGGNSSVFGGSVLSMSDQDILNQIYSDGGAPIDYGAGMGDPTEQDVLDFMSRWGE